MHCISCHTKAGVGGMALTNYKEVSAYGKMIQYVTENKLMPPWTADPQYSHLKNYNALTVDEIAAIKNWVKTGMPEGKLPVQPKVSPLNQTKEVAITDATLAMEKSFKISGDYKETSQVFVIPT
jgi:mono/diheme cytochrome c family protein